VKNRYTRLESFPIDYLAAEVANYLTVNKHSLLQMDGGIRYDSNGYLKSFFGIGSFRDEFERGGGAATLKFIPKATNARF
jgi:hypothetical protein